MFNYFYKFPILTSFCIYTDKLLMYYIQEVERN